MTAAERPDEPLEVVFVCTGNQARSPLAEALLRLHAGEIPLRVTSFGTLGVVGAPALAEAVAAGARLGVDLSSHRSRSLRAADLGTADLVACFEPFHVAAAVVDARAPASRAFLLGELVDLLEPVATVESPVGHAREAIAAADARRVRSRPDGARAVTDPLGKPDHVMAQVAAEVDALVRALASRLFTPAGDAPAAPFGSPDVRS